MAIKDARKVETKKRTHAAASSSVAMAEMPPHGANHVQPPPPQPLPPGVYFSPTPEECLGFLNRRIAGDTELRDARGHIRHDNVYGESPDTLRQRHPPASIRERERTWWFMSETKFQSQTAGGGASKRNDRQVKAGTYWRLEQSKEKLDDDGFKNTFGFYVGPHKRKDKTPWLMREFTSTNDDGAGKGGVPALYRVYVTPRATDEQLRQIYGEDGVKHEPDGNKKPARIMVPAEYFNGIAKLLPQGSVRGVVAQEHGQAPPPPPPAVPEEPLEYSGQQELFLGQYEQQQGQPVAPDGLHGDFNGQQGQYLGQYQYQQEQYVGQYYEQQQQQEQYVGQYYEQEHVQAPPLPPLSPVAPGGLLDDSYSQQEQYQYQCQQEQEQYQYQCQQEQYLGQYYEQQQEPLSVIAPPIPPPASPGLLAELAASENLSMPMADLMSMLDDNEQPAEPVKGEEPNWDSLDDIVDDDELANFNKEG